MVLLASANVSSAESDKPPFYKISYQGQTVYLLGSIHIGREDFYPMAPQIETAFENAFGLVVEADISRANMPQLIQRYGSSSEPKLQDERWITYCEDNTKICDELANYSPWLQASQLTMMRFEALGYQSQWGNESVLISKNNSRPLFELESAELQLKMFASIKRDTQWAMVLGTIESSNDEILELITAWRNGDEVALEKLVVGQMQDEGDIELVEKVLWQRNINMTHHITELMMWANAELKLKKQRGLVAKEHVNGPLFVVVGAGHVVGDKGIPIQIQTRYNAKVQNCWVTACFE